MLQYFKVVTITLLAASVLGASILGWFVLNRWKDDVLEKNRNWIQTAEEESSGSAYRRLFANAVYYGFVYYDVNTDSVRFLTRREVGVDLARLVPKARPNNSAPYTKETTLTLLWRDRGAGPKIRNEIVEHQNQRLFVAVHDAGLTPYCALGTGDESTQDCQSQWTIAPAGLDASVDISAGASIATAPDPTAFQSLKRLRRPFFGPWHMIPVYSDTDRLFTLKPIKPVTSGSGQITIDVVGVKPKLLPKAANDAAEVTSYCAFQSGYTNRFRLVLCDNIETGPKVPLAHRITLDKDNWTDETFIEARATQLPTLSAAIREKLRFSEDLGDIKDIAIDATIRVDDRFSLKCGQSQCWPILSGGSVVRTLSEDLILSDALLQQAERKAQAGQGGEENTTPPIDSDLTVKPDLPLLARTDDPLIVVRTTGEIALSELAAGLNLQPMLGVSGLENRSYLNFLNTLPSDLSLADLALTFDADMQTVAVSQMRAMLQDRTYRPEAYLNRVPSRFNDERRAAFVLLDLRDEPGAVRAAVSYPFFDPEIPLWNLRAAAAGAEGGSPATPTPWRGLDSRVQPGSSMKVVSALSLIRSSLSMNQGIADDLRPLLAQSVFGANLNTYRDDIGFSLQTVGTNLTPDPALRADRFTFGDRGTIPADYPEGTFNACAPSGLAALNAAGGRDYGICEALARSSNIFFGRMAVFENRDLVQALYDENAEPRHFSGLGQTFQSLGLAGDVPLVLVDPELEKMIRNRPAIEAPRFASANGLGGDEGPLAFVDFHERNLAQNAYGQNAFVSPLTMASAVGAIAINRRIHPHIARQSGYDFADLSRMLPEDDPVALAMLSELHRGMAAVMRQGGTGYSAFGAASQTAAALRTRVWAKTGTANIETGNSTELVHWFVGWITDTSGQPSHAFACSISHASASGPCAAMAGSILGQMAENGQL